MNQKRKTSDILLSLLANHICQFLIGLMAIAFVTRIAEGIDFIYIKLVVKSLSYLIFFYLGTPFTLYWLAYVSAVKLTKLKLGITILLVGMYSYVFWDCYFFYKNTLAELIFT